MLSEWAKLELIGSTKRQIELVGVETLIKVAPRFVETAGIIAGMPECPEHMRKAYREYAENRQEINQIVAGLLGMM